jgi:4-amino-4-deoxy-L-arabinose transferase-like glycosyltransferase
MSCHLPKPDLLPTRYIRCVQELGLRELVRKKARFYLWAGLAALALRMFFVIWFPGVVDDSRLYANISENWLQHGVYAVTNSGAIMPTLSRLPGYPAFLAAIFALFGIENFRAVLLAQVLFDLGTCFLIADMAWRLLSSQRAAQAAFLLAGLCPFLANYAATALTETLEIFFTALAFDFAVRGLTCNDVDPGKTRARLTWLGCGLSVGAAILLRPDGGILLLALGGYLFWLLARNWRGEEVQSRRPAFTARAILWAGTMLVIGAIVPLIPWTLRNLHTLHRFEALAPRYANDSDEPVMSGFNRWVKTWTAEYVSVEDIYWKVPGDTLDAGQLPNRAFDSPQQKEKTRALFDAYNRDHDLTPEIDAGFVTLAAERIHAAPLRYYVWLPAARIADMWLRPRTELFPADPRWWEFNDDKRWLAVSIGFGVVNLLYVVMAGAGLRRSHKFFGIGLFVLFITIRSAFLGTLENPEPRYTLECFPAVIILASALFQSPA